MVLKLVQLKNLTITLVTGNNLSNELNYINKKNKMPLTQFGKHKIIYV
jgi:hypothetical protein